MWKKIDKNQWENHENERKYDFHIIRYNPNWFIIDMFDAKIEDNNAAHVASTTATSLQGAKKEAREWV